jgi:GH25 family lysozyme M1 (1,4-beta-N-acetylmuramidase)
MILPAQVGYGVDVSHFQDPSAIDARAWAQLGVTHADVRIDYGTTADDRAAAFVRLFRSANLTVGGYHFWRRQPFDIQFDAFRRDCDAAGFRAGDVAPALDVEPDVKATLAPDDSEALRAFFQAILDNYGGARLYITQRDWHVGLGAPEWVIDMSSGLDGATDANACLWCAEYPADPNLATPATPGDVVPGMWQHRVGPVDPRGPAGFFKGGAQIDQSRIYRALPTIR